MDNIAHVLQMASLQGPSIVDPAPTVSAAAVHDEAHTWKQPWKRMLCVVNHVVVHSVGAGTIYGVFTIFDLGIEEVGNLNHMMFFESSQYAFTLSSVFKWADLATVLSFVASGLWQITKEMVR